MKYLSGIHALNIECELDTCGDWHRSGIRWDVIDDRLLESRDSVFGEYGIEVNKTLNFIEDHPIYNVANHIRACLDLIAMGEFSLAQGMNKDYIGNDDYNHEIFSKVSLLKHQSNWLEVDAFMYKEYMLKWIDFKNHYVSSKTV